MKVRYIGSSIDQARWGGNDDPAGLLIEGQEYELLRKEVHSWHTKYTLADFPGKQFNSASFEEITTAMTKDERIVREAWEEITFKHPDEVIFWTKPGTLIVNTDRVGNPDWRASAEATIQRQKKIDDVKEEIEELKARVDGCNETLPRLLTDLMKKETMRKLRIWKRILAARQAALADLQRGWKGIK